MMADYEKFVNEAGDVGVLVSHGYGAGWFSWNEDNPRLLFDKALVRAVLDGDLTKAAQLAEQMKLPGSDYVCVLGAKGLQVHWLVPGTQFRIDEYDGAESIETREGTDWQVA